MPKGTKKKRVVKKNEDSDEENKEVRIFYSHYCRLMKDSRSTFLNTTG
jgi:hypothetical protein